MNNELEKLWHKLHKQKRIYHFNTSMSVDDLIKAIKFILEDKE